MFSGGVFGERGWGRNLTHRDAQGALRPNRASSSLQLALACFLLGDRTMQNEAYYCPPREWTFSEVRLRYERLCSSYEVKEPLLLQYPYESELAKLKHALWDISSAVKGQDSAAIEVAMEFVFSRVFFHYSGYIRSTMARRLKGVTLPEAAKERLRRGLFNIFSSDIFGPEHKEFARLLRSIGLGAMEAEYKMLLGACPKQQAVGREVFGNLAVPIGSRPIAK